MAVNLTAECYRTECATYDKPTLADHYPLVSTFYHVPIILFTYFLLVKVILPKWMKNREPFVLKEIMMAYNLMQVIVNCYLVYKATRPWGFSLPQAWSHACEPGQVVGYSLYNEMQLLEGGVLYHIVKIVDLLDTVFFVLRKKESQVTVLHVFHHSTMIINSWLSLGPFREHVLCIFGLMNSFVHVWMYSYYFLAAFGPKMQKYLWWKKHLTRLQLLQFTIALAILGKMKVEGCETRPFFWTLWVFNITAYFIMFLHFYVSAYSKKKTKDD